jgi:hypothetical protein
MVWPTVTSMPATREALACEGAFRRESGHNEPQRHPAQPPCWQSSTGPPRASSPPSADWDIATLSSCHRPTRRAVGVRRRSRAGPGTATRSPATPSKSWGWSYRRRPCRVGDEASPDGACASPTRRSGRRVTRAAAWRRTHRAGPAPTPAGCGRDQGGGPGRRPPSRGGNAVPAAVGVRPGPGESERRGAQGARGARTGPRLGPCPHRAVLQGERPLVWLR